MIWHDGEFIYGGTRPEPGRYCQKWGDAGHNWLGFPIRGWLPWRRYRVCCACGHEERIR